MDHLKRNKSIIKDILFPILAWGVIIIVFLNVKNIPYDFSEKNHVVLRYAAKVVMTILFPLMLIYLFYRDKRNFGIYFPKLKDSFQLSLRAYAICGPAGITFLLIGILGWQFDSWLGSITLSIVYLIALYFVLRLIQKLPTREPISNPNNTLWVFILLSVATMVIAFLSYNSFPIISKIPYYIFIVGLGEELLFRGYIQSSFNNYFGKPFTIANVSFGWGLILAALLFGLIHALVSVPPNWPWMLFTFVLGLTLGFLREKDGSILSAVLLHAMIDMPLAFID